MFQVTQIVRGLRLHDNRMLRGLRLHDNRTLRGLQVTEVRLHDHAFGVNLGRGLPARGCYVRVGVGSAVSSRLLLTHYSQAESKCVIT
jgi:hypothetical protein